MVLSRCCCGFEGLNMVQVWCVLIVHNCGHAWLSSLDLRIIRRLSSSILLGEKTNTESFSSSTSNALTRIGCEGHVAFGRNCGYI